MLDLTKTISMSGYSYVEQDVSDYEGSTTTHKERVPVVYLSADVSDSGAEPHVSFTINNKDLYIANKKTCDAEISEFYTQALSLVK